MIPLENAKFSLDISGVAGFFGGEQALTAMSTVSFIKGRKYLGWYNSPGSYTLAKKYGRMVNSRFWKGFFPGDDTDINQFLGFAGHSGPAFLGAYSGEKMSHTSYIAHLLLSECKERGVMVREVTDWSMQYAGPYPCSVSVAHISYHNESNYGLKIGRKAWLAGIPILVSVSGAVICAYYHDWYCFSMILLGMVSSGVSCYAAGRGKLSFRQPPTPPGSPPCDGVLYSGDDFVALIGHERSVRAVTRGTFRLEYDHHYSMGFPTALLIIQFLLQLILIPQGTLFGQIMFISTFACSWGYHCYLSSIDKEGAQREILTGEILGLDRPRLKKYMFTKRTTAVVFLLLVLQPQEEDAERILNELLPNNTESWKSWKEQVLERLRTKNGFESLVNPYTNEAGGGALLDSLIKYAQIAYETYKQHTLDGIGPNNAENA